MTTVMETLETNTINQNTERILKGRTKTFIEEQQKFYNVLTILRLIAV